MKYVLTDNSRVDFIARAPLHAFKGWAVEGVQGTLEANFSAGILQSLAAEVETGCFDTADPDRTEAMSRYFSLAEHPHASFALSQCQEIVSEGGGCWRVRMLGILSFVDIRRQLPVTGTVREEGGRLLWELQCKWSFTAYGLKAPRLLMLSVRDIVDIKAHLEFIPSGDEKEIHVH